MLAEQPLTDVLTLLRKQKQSLFEKFGVQSLAVFGSYVKNAHTADSDIDIFVELEPGHKTFDNYMDLKFCLEDTLHKKIDLAIKESLRKEIKAEVLREAVYV
ncbi:MAG: nucleotidyltransferase family protein [candidate division KSB1 bacterium]